MKSAMKRQRSTCLGRHGTAQSSVTPARKGGCIPLFWALAVWGASIYAPAADAFGTEAINSMDGVRDQVVTSKRGGYVVSYVTSPAPIPLNEMFEMHVEIRERHKRSPAKRVSLEVDAGMRAHNHGMNTLPVVERQEDGTFWVRGMLFHMPGEWNMTFSIKRGLMNDKADVDVVLK